MKLGVAVFINIVLCIIWLMIHKLRKSSSGAVKIWDNSYEFYESLGEKEKQEYWEADSRLIDFFFLLLFVIMEVTLLLYISLRNPVYWIVFFLFGLSVLCGYSMKKSWDLQKKFK